jgi:hypothetical protein
MNVVMLNCVSLAASATPALVMMSSPADMAQNYWVLLNCPAI